MRLCFQILHFNFTISLEWIFILVMRSMKETATWKTRTLTIGFASPSLIPQEHFLPFLDKIRI